MYQDQFPHEEYPDGIIKISLQKERRLKGLFKRYTEIGFTDFSLIELAQLSLRQWMDKKYPVPQGYVACWGNYVKKKTIKNLIHS